MSGESNRPSRYDIGHAPSYYESMPRELIDMCLECKKRKCGGNCKRYDDKEREINRYGRVDNEGNLLPKGGSVARKHYFRGGYVTDAQMAEMCDVSLRTVRRARVKGKSMEEIYVYYEQKHRLKGD